MSFKLNRPKFNNKPYSIINEGMIDGLGVIADKDFRKGEFIDTAFEDESKVVNMPMVDTRTIIGKSLNHKKDPNAMNVSENNQLNVYALKDIKAGEEITVNYNNAPDYVKKGANLKGYKQ